MRMLPWVTVVVVLSVVWCPQRAHAQAERPLDSTFTAQRDAIRSERDASIVLYAIGGTLLTGGGLTTIYAWGAPCVGRCEGGPIALWTSIGVGALGFVLLVSALTVGQNAHTHWQRLQAAGVTLAPGPGELGLSLTLRF